MLVEDRQDSSQRQPEPGWFRGPFYFRTTRWWDGSAWTDFQASRTGRVYRRSLPRRPMWIRLAAALALATAVVGFAYLMLSSIANRALPTRVGLMSTTSGPVLVAGACPGEELLGAEVRVAGGEGEVLWRVSGRASTPAQIDLTDPPATMKVEIPFEGSLPANGVVTVSYESTEFGPKGGVDVEMSELREGWIVGGQGMHYQDVESFGQLASSIPPCGIKYQVRLASIATIGGPILGIGLLLIDLWLRRRGYSKPWKPPRESARISDPGGCVVRPT